MKVFRNEKLIQRNSKIGQYASLAGTVTAVGVVAYIVMTFFNPDMLSKANQGVLLAIVFGSLIVTQASMYLGNRFGRRPRPDEHLDAALKGIPGDYSIHHYTTPIPHVLAGPAGLWVLIPYHQKGKITYRKNRWKNTGGGFAQGYMRIFGQESIGRPDLEAESQAAALEKFLKKKIEEGESDVPPIHAALVFIDPNVEIEAEDAPIPSLHAKKLKDHLRKTAKENPLPAAELERIKTLLIKG